MAFLKRNIRVTIDFAILIAWWTIFYFPIWIGSRHVGYDMDGFNYPIDRYLFEGLRQLHHFPQWDWYEYNGSDLAGNIQAGAYYPPKLLLEIALLLTGQQLTYPVYQFFALLHVLALSVSAYLVGRALFLKRLWALVGSVLLSYTGILQAQIQHLWFLEILPWIPIAAYGAYRYTFRPSRKAFVTYCVGSLGLFLVGYPLQYLTIEIEILAAAVCFAVLQPGSLAIRSLRNAVFGLSIAQVIIFAVCSIAIFPFISLAHGSIAQTHGGPLPLSTAITFVLPNAFGHLSGAYTIADNPSTSYYFVGFSLELVIFLIPTIWRSISANLVQFGVAFGFLIANVVLIFGPLSDFLNRTAPALDVIRPQSACMPLALVFACFATLVFVRADRVASKRNKRLLRAAAVVACLSLFLNRPAYFSTPTGPASDVDTMSRNFVANGVPSETFIVAVDQGSIGGSADNWPRVVHMRSLGGEDPLAQTDYLKKLDAENVHESGRRIFFGSDVNIRWLEDNGVGFIQASSPDLLALAKRSGFEMTQNLPFAIFGLPGARRLATSACPGSVDARLLADEVQVTSNLIGSGCSIRLTTNYSRNFISASNVKIEPVLGSLGMTISPVPPGRQILVLTYSNPLVKIGAWVSLLSTCSTIAILISWPMRRTLLTKKREI